jgi:hypothetical protein
MLDQDDLQKLLRMKRYEQPPHGYFDNFLREFQQRQREELLRRPLWQIAWERVETFLSQHSVGTMPYAAATAAVLIFAGIASMNILGSGRTQETVLARSVAVAPEALLQNASAPLALDSRIPLPNLSSSFVRPIQSGALSSDARPHYVIDARPVSYEPPFSF